MFKKAWYCVGRRVTFRACDSSFKDDIKNSVLSRLIFRHKKWVKPVAAAIEVVAVLIVIVAGWSLVEVGKVGLSLYVYGTCNVSQPEACILGEGDVCSTEDASGSNAFVGWFEEWGDLFTALPARIKTWQAEDYLKTGMTPYNYSEGREVAIDIFDPGCINCLKSFNNQLDSGFFDQYNVYLIPYSIKSTEKEDGYRFPNSHLISSYIVAAREYTPVEVESPDWLIVKKLFTEKDADLDVDYQSAFNGVKGLSGTPYSAEKAGNVLKGWLKEFGFSDEAIAEIAEQAHSEAVKDRIEEYHHLVDNDIQTKSIPTTIYDGKRHIGVYHP
jgi:hypothetical protein